MGNASTGGNAFIPSVGAGGAAISAGSASQNTGTVVFSNSNGVSFGLNNGVLTATVTPGAAAGIAAMQAGTQTQTSGTAVFANSNGVSFGMSGSSQITASVAAQTNQTLGLYASSQTVGQSSSSTVDARSMSFVGQGIVSVGNSAGSFLISATTAAQTNQSLGIYGSSQTTGQSSSTTVDARSLTLVGQGAVSIGASAGSILISAAAGAQSNQTLGLYASSNTTGQSSSSTVDARSLTFVGAGAISVGLSGGSYLISSPATTAVTMLSAGVSTGGNTSGNTGTVTGLMVLAGGNNITLSGSTNGSSLTITISAGGAGSGAAISAGTQSQNTGTVVFSNSNNVSFGMSNSSVITASASYSQVSSVGLYALGNTTQNSSTTLDQRTQSFNALGAMTMGFSNGSIQVSAPATSSLSATGAVSISTNGSTISIGAPNYGTLSYWDNGILNGSATSTQLGLGSVVVQQIVMEGNLSVSAIREFISVSVSSSSNSSFAQTYSFQAAIYTKNGSTLSLASSGSQSYAFTNTSNNSVSVLSGIKGITIPLNASMTPGNYWLGLWSSSASANANWATASNVVINEGALTYNGMLGSATSGSNQVILGGGLWSTTSANIPSSIGISHITGSVGNIAPFVNMYNYTA